MCEVLVEIVREEDGTLRYFGKKGRLPRSFIRFPARIDTKE